jgi:hypothetical protein
VPSERSGYRYSEAEQARPQAGCGYEARFNDAAIAII